ncbi:MAG: hypothetical protein DMF78_19945 [Acidobacteria bacterium]|nr:MAG: hypothetical protein DMF78_19945 [Acidobacteriota bacterium]
MRELIHQRVVELIDRQGTVYDRARVYAERQSRGTWAAWVEFVSAKRDKVLQTDRETTQSTLEGVAYWATGLEPIYFEGAFDRAYKRTVNPRPEAVPASPTTGGGIVAFRVRSLDPEVPFKVMATRTVVPGVRRQVYNGGVIVYLRAIQPALRNMPQIYEFLAQFGSENAAGILANRLWSDLQGTGATLEIGRVEVQVQGAAIRDALLRARAGSPGVPSFR